MPKRIDVPRLFELWSNPALSRSEIAHLLGVGSTALHRAVSRYKLPSRNVLASARRARRDPTPEEIAIRARECRERHYAERRREVFTPEA